VRLVVTDPVYIDDIYVQNTPAITDVNVIVTVKNTTGKEVVRDVVTDFFSNWVLKEVPNPLRSSAEYTIETKNVKLVPGDNTVTYKLSAPVAGKWDLNHPDLYTCYVWLRSEHILNDDRMAQPFGFRWFAPEDVGKDAVFRLNGKRIVLRTAISWGFWPINGIYPTPELAEKQIRTAKELGLNMLNFHRAIGQPSVLDKADELGLLYFEEPGGYVSGDATPFAQALAREKLLRMVKRDRSHPSLVIYNMINEQWNSHGADKDKAVLDWHERDLRDAHAVDPSRTVVHTSAWAGRVKMENDPAKMHMRPFDDTVHWEGWFDYHRAGGPEVWKENLYKNPSEFYNFTSNKTEIVYYGEEGAISSPPRLEKIKAALEASPNQGWDGGMYLDWYKQFDDFLTRKNLRAAFPTVDALTSAMGDVSLYHQGRKIENLRICNANDGYAVNGWEAEPVENHSGIVDEFRNPKGDPAIMAYYNQPLYVAVKPRSQFAESDGKVTVDFYVVNEKDLKGPHTLKITALDSAGKRIFAQEIPVTLTGGETYGQMLAEGIKIPAAAKSGMQRIEASLVDASGKDQAKGHDEILVVDWKSAQLSGKGAVWESGGAVRDFFAKEKNFDASAYEDKLGHLDWIVVARAPGEGEPTPIPADRFKNAGAKTSGLKTTFFSGNDFKTQIHQRTDKNVDLSHEAGASPDAAVPLTEFYSVRWEGQLVPPADGSYTFVVRSTGGVRLLIDGKPIIDAADKKGEQTNKARIELAAIKPVSVLLEFKQHRDKSRCKLMWTIPEANAPDAAKLLARVRNKGTTLLVLDRADTWMDLIRNSTGIKCDGAFSIGTAWLGGLFFVREHSLFKDLPVNCAMDWPYQSVVKDGKNRLGLLLEGGELVAGCWHSYPMKLGTAVAVIPCGKGRIVVSTLDICGSVGSPDGAANVARKLLCNFIEFAAAKH
jgi:beta-galactosidase